jgi:hypothetical protein
MYSWLRHFSSMTFLAMSNGATILGAYGFVLYWFNLCMHFFGFQSARDYAASRVIAGKC